MYVNAGRRDGMKKLISLITVLILCFGLAIPVSAASYQTISIGYGENFGDSGFYFDNCIKFSAATMERNLVGVNVITLKKGSTVTFFNSYAPDPEDGAAIFLIPYKKAKAFGVAGEDGCVSIKGNHFVDAGYVFGQYEYGYITKQMTVKAEKLFTNGVDMLDLMSFGQEYHIVLEGTVQPLKAEPTASTVYVNGKNVSFDAYKINDNNFLKLRDLAYVLSGSEKQFNVTWDAENNAILLVRGEEYVTVGGEMTGKGAGVQTPTETDSRILLDGDYISLTAFNIGGNNYFKLRDLGQVFDFEVDWDGAANAIIVDTSKSYTAD